MNNEVWIDLLSNNNAKNAKKKHYFSKMRYTMDHMRNTNSSLICKKELFKLTCQSSCIIIFTKNYNKLFPNGTTTKKKPFSHIVVIFTDGLLYGHADVNKRRRKYLSNAKIPQCPKKKSKSKFININTTWILWSIREDYMDNNYQIQSIILITYQQNIIIILRH